MRVKTGMRENEASLVERKGWLREGDGRGLSVDGTGRSSRHVQVTKHSASLYNLTSTTKYLPKQCSHLYEQ